ncbi:MAG: hypothetical protein GX856_03600 [Gammaproteobacteria bacterium]|jgi:hypothetical protein|nr:hypothetical protein [Gammaproteobacteria bacterium]
MGRRRFSTRANPARRILLRGLVVALLVAAVAYGFAFYRSWQLSDSCTGNGGEWDAELEQCTFRLPLPEPAPGAPNP